MAIDFAAFLGDLAISAGKAVVGSFLDDDGDSSGGSSGTSKAAKPTTFAPLGKASEQIQKQSAKRAFESTTRNAPAGTPGAALKGVDPSSLENNYWLNLMRNATKEAARLRKA